MGNPTFVFSLGAWVIPATFDATRSHLDVLGFPSVCPAHPSIGAEPPTKTLSDDVASLREVLVKLADEGQELVVVGHSYGGVVTSCAVEGLSREARAKEGKTGGVIKVVYLAAFAIDKGQSLLGMLGGNYLPWMKVEVIGKSTMQPKIFSRKILTDKRAITFLQMVLERLDGKIFPLKSKDSGMGCYSTLPVQSFRASQHMSPGEIFPVLTLCVSKTMHCLLLSKSYSLPRWVAQRTLTVSQARIRRF